MSEWYEIADELRESGLVGMTREASYGADGRTCGVLGDWYEERGEGEAAGLARGYRPVEALRIYLESRTGSGVSDYSVWALVGFA